MKCPKCKGRMVPDYIIDSRSMRKQDSSFRCVNCGEIVDPVILMNREKSIGYVGFKDSMEKMRHEQMYEKDHMIPCPCWRCKKQREELENDIVRLNIRRKRYRRQTHV